MPITLGRYNNDRDCWGLSHNDYHKGLLGVRDIYNLYWDISSSNTPPQFISGGAFQHYKSADITISANSSGNSLYLSNTTYAVNQSELAIASSTITINWNTTLCLSTGHDGSYVLFCSTISDNAHPVLGIASSTEAYAINYYSSIGNFYHIYTSATTQKRRALAKFYYESSCIKEIQIFDKYPLNVCNYDQLQGSLKYYENIIVDGNTTSYNVTNSIIYDDKIMNIYNESSKFVDFKIESSNALTLHNQNEFFSFRQRAHEYIIDYKSPSFYEIISSTDVVINLENSTRIPLGYEIEYRLGSSGITANIYSTGNTIEGSTSIILSQKNDFIIIKKGSTIYYKKQYSSSSISSSNIYFDLVSSTGNLYITINSSFTIDEGKEVEFKQLSSGITTYIYPDSETIEGSTVFPLYSKYDYAIIRKGSTGYYIKSCYSKLDTGKIYKNDYTNISLGMIKIEYDNFSGASTFIDGELITFTSTATTNYCTGYLYSHTTRALYLKNFYLNDSTGSTFIAADNEIITGSLSSATALIDGDQIDNNFIIPHDFYKSLDDLDIKLILSASSENFDDSYILNVQDSENSTDVGYFIKEFSSNSTAIIVHTGYNGLLRSDGFGNFGLNGSSDTSNNQFHRIIMTYKR